MHSLPLFFRLTGRSVILLGTGEAADAKRRLLDRAGAIVTGDELAPAQLAFVALEGDLADAAAARLRDRGVLVNVVDRPDLCDFTTPAIIDRDPLLIAIGSGGASAGLAKVLRQRLELIIPSGLGAIANAMAGARSAIRQRWPDPAGRRRAIDAAMAEGGPLDPFGNAEPVDVDQWLSTLDNGSPPARIELIRLTSDDPDLMTLRDARLLGSADAIWHDGSVPEEILVRARADGTRHIAASPPHDITSGLTLWVEMAR